MSENGINQYIITGKKKFIDVKEYESILNYKNISDIDTSEKYKVISGSVIPQLGYTKEQVKREIMANLNKKLGFLEDDKCILSDIIDIHFIEDKYNYKIPFSALVKTNLKINKCKTLFLRDQKLSIEKNISNRKLLFAVNKEKTITKMYKDFWKREIPENLLYISRRTW